ncbi:MAG: hypothetical protein ACTS6G_00685 [Candidatus Hodgkinia cicadicola]
MQLPLILSSIVRTQPFILSVFQSLIAFKYSNLHSILQSPKNFGSVTFRFFNQTLRCLLVIQYHSSENMISEYLGNISW